MSFVRKDRKAPLLPSPFSILTSRFRRFHSDERGVIAPLSVFAIFLFTILMVQIINVGRQIDDKIRIQNAADASAYSGATVLTRGMNAIAFSNHMLCEVFALTAYMREGRDRKSEQFVPEILSAWENVGELFRTRTGSLPMSQKFRAMGEAIVAKVPIEREMVRSFGEMTYHQSAATLPIFEYILAGPEEPTYEGATDFSDGGFIPRFQRAVLFSAPAIATKASDEIATRYGVRVQSQHRDGALRSLLWTTNVTVVGGQDETNPVTRTLPVVDPSRLFSDLAQMEYVNPDCPTCVTCYECISRTQREQLATHYLEDWIRHWMSPYFEYPDVVSGGVNGDAFPSGSFDSGGMPQQYGAISAKMSNLINLWRVFTCANLRKLLNDEYPFTNLPFVLRNPPTFPDTCVDPSNQGLSAARPCPRPSPLTPAVLERDYQFVSQVYWPHQRPMFPNLFRNPLERDSQNYATAFAQASIFLPRAKFQCCPWGYEVPCSAEGGICCLIRYDNSPGSWNSFTLSNTDPSVIQTIIDDEHTFSFDARWERFGQWNSFNQNWTTKLVPATSSSIPSILSQHPSNYLNGYLQNYQVPRVAQMTPTQFQIVNGH